MDWTEKSVTGKPIERLKTFETRGEVDFGAGGGKGATGLSCLHFRAVRVNGGLIKVGGEEDRKTDS